MSAANHAPRALVCLPIASRTDDVGIRRPRRLSPSCVCVCVCVCGKGQDFPLVTSVPCETTAELQAAKVSSNALPNNKKLLLLCWLLV